MKRKSGIVSIIAALTALFCGCAQIRTLKGGEKDTTPPVALSVMPPNLTTGFRASQITFTFDEYVQLNNINQELIISPPLLKTPKVRIRQKSVIVTLEEELLPNTTYTFNFGDGVADVNEGNKAVDLLYIFSTGPAIDSLSVSGRVTDAYTAEPCAGCRVMLFDNDTAILSVKPRPVYFAKTKPSGEFELKYLHEGEYHLYCVEDENSNFRADDDEKAAFISSPVKPLFADTIRYNIYSSAPRPERPLVEEYKTDSAGSVRFKWDPFFKNISARLIDSDIETSLLLSNDSAYIRFKGKPTEKQERLVIGFGESLADTIRVPFFTSSQSGMFRLLTNFRDKILSESPLILTTPFWFRPADEAKISLLKDSVEIPVKVVFDSTLFSCSLNASLKDGNTYKLIVLPGAFNNESAGTNDTLRVSFSTYKSSELGSIRIQLKGKLNEDDLLILSDKNGKEFYRTMELSGGSVFIPRLPAGEYVLRIISDENKNGLFDPVNLKLKTQPERVMIFDGKIAVRANWELNLDWDISE